MKSFDVAVIGSGPAGASAAFELSKSGISTVIIDKETLPRYKTCGGGFVYRGVKNMPIDISSVIEREFREIDIYYSSKQKKITAKRDQPIITMVMRDAFDNLIVEKARENGVTLLQKHKVEAISFGDEVQIIHTSEGDVSAKFIIAADGALSPIAKMAGWEETRTIIPAIEYEVEVSPIDFERLSKTARFDIDIIPYGYGWCFPKKNHLSIGLGAIVKNNKNKNLKSFYADYLKLLGINEVISETAHGFVIPISPRKDSFVRKNVFLTGDAAGLADAFVAEGISNAILSGILAAKAIIDSKLDSSLASALYVKNLEERILPDVKLGIQLSKWFYGQPKIRNMVLNKYGDYFSNALTDVFMGDRNYPKDYKESIKRKVKEIFF